MSQGRAHTMRHPAAGGSSARALAMLRRLEWGVRHASDSILGGRYRSAFRGRGMEFDQVVKYQWGDEVRDIDWKVTLVVLLEDTPSLNFGSGERTRREVLLEVAGLLALLAAANHDRLAVAHASPEGFWFREPVRGRLRILQHAAHLMGMPPPGGAGGIETRVDWRLLQRTVPRHAVFVWLGDFAPRPEPEGWGWLRRQCVALGVRADDPWDIRLPENLVMSAYDPVAGQLVPIDTGNTAQRRAHAQWVVRRELAWESLFPKELQRLAIRTDADPLHALVGFFQRRMALGSAT
jgi:uncharacterized protein (DUF58 family)